MNQILDFAFKSLVSYCKNIESNQQLFEFMRESNKTLLKLQEEQAQALSFIQQEEQTLQTIREQYRVSCQSKKDVETLGLSETN